MNFLGRKNLTEIEELLYIPALHWMYVVKHLIRSSFAFFGFIAAWFIFSVLGIFGLGSGGFSDSIFYIILIWFFCLLFTFLLHVFYYKCVKYAVTNKRLIIKKGILTTVTTEIPIDRIESINSHQSLFGSLFNYGNIIINGIGGKGMVFFMVHRPYALRRKIIEFIEKSKITTVIHGNIPKYERPEKPKPEPIDDTLLWGNFVKVS